jgi:Tol biopolymer transport system component/serine/threonine protein kinase
LQKPGFIENFIKEDEMSAERYQQAAHLYHAALEREPDERAAFLDEACGGDDELRREIESLLKAHDKAGNYFAAPAMEVAAGLLAERRSLLRVGQSLSHYRVLSLIGAGGMGEVYLAEDTRLGRKVGLKLLPAAFTGNPDRVRRFEQEAKAASALNQPNILTIHEIGEIDNCHFIVSEYVEGETLRQRMKDGKMASRAALDVATQVASALAAAHAARITHRDIKPENVMVRPDGLVKVLDFGLAKLTETQSPPTDSQASTVAKLSTDPGVVMGTVSYMSPEQARGLKVDHRTDIFSLGVMLYEMVTGRRPFEGETASDIIAAILQNAPAPINLSGQSSVLELDQVISRMIEKDRAARYQSSAELRAELRGLQRKLEVDETSAAGQVLGEAKREGGSVTGEKSTPVTGKTAATSSPVKPRVRWLPLALVLGLLALGASVFWFVKIQGGASETQTDERPVIVKTAQLTTWKGLDFYPALARDGKSIAFSSDRSGSFEIYVKQLVAGAREVQITSDGGQNYQPAFSPDGTLIAYHSKKRGGIWVVPATGGVARQLTEFGSSPAWSPDGSQIAFQSVTLHMIGFRTLNARPSSTLWTVPSQGGGEQRQLTQAGTPPGGHGSPSWSPDGKRIVFDSSGFDGLAVWSISAQGNDLKKISERTQGAFGAVYAPDGRSIFFTADDGWSLYKVSLSEAGDPVGEPVLVFSGSGPHINKLSIAANGKSIVYTALTTMSNIWAIPLAPKTNTTSGKPLQLTQNANTCDVAPAFSPDGKAIAYFTFATGAPRQIWTMDAEGRNQTQITTGSGSNPWWFPDGSRIAFKSERENRDGLWAINIEGGKEKKLFEFDEYTGVARLSPDGKSVAFNSRRSGAPNLWVVPIEGGEPKQLTFEKESASYPAWSPDGKWIAFEIRRGEDTHVAFIPSGGGEPIQLTSDRGQSLVHDWSPDGERILFAGQRNGVWNVWSVARSSRQQKQMTNYTRFDSYVRAPAWSPLGDKIVYEYADNTGNIWLMELK